MNKEFYEKMLQNIYEGIYFVDMDRKITFWNKGAERISGFSVEEVLGKCCYDNILNHVDDNGNKLCLNGCPLHKSIKDAKSRESAIYLHHKKGHRVPVSVRTVPIEENGEIIGAVEVFVDNSEKIKIIRDLEKCKEIAMIDQLTRLPNRRYLNTYLESKMSEYKSLGIEFGVAFFDIDHFKKVNDTYGHDVGDEVLTMVSKTYESVLRKSDIVGRWGGEEFIAVFVGIDEEGLWNVSEKIRMLVENSALRSHEINLKVTISIGATMVKKDDTIDDIVKRSDTFMYKSKENGRNRVTVG